MNNRVVVVDNFFDNFHQILPSLKKIKLYNCKEFHEQFPYMESANKIDAWPGYRSQNFEDGEPFLESLIIKEFNQKFNNFFGYNKFNVDCFMHLRLKEDDKKDYIHKDPVEYTMMIYISETNLNSGTVLYDENKNINHTINFVQNRAVIFPGLVNHKSMLNYGDNIDNGRLTINVFFNSFQNELNRS